MERLGEPDEEQNYLLPVADIWELAFEAWAFRFGQNAAAVSRWLESEHDYRVTDRAVQYRATKEQWAGRLRSRLGELAPGVQEQTISELVFGSLEAARHLRAVVTGDDDKPDKTRVTAAIALLDRSGYSPVGRNDKAGSISQTDKRGIRFWFSEDDVQAILSGETGE